jgi:tetratricopeptide (TPR) repeat protein
MVMIRQRYELLEKLGAGGMGTVFLARDRLAQTTLALKRLIPNYENASDTQLGEYFTALATEFRTLARLRHPHVVRVIDFGFTFDEGKPQPFFTMEFLPHAKPLTEFTKGLPQAEQIRLLNEMLLALIYLHRNGVIHRDLKPDNVLVDQHGQVKVLDFGLATGATTRSVTGFTEGTAGTISYMAPELFSDETATVQSDLYAAGMLIYQVLTDIYPFNQKNVMLLVNDILNKIADITMLDDELGELIQALLAKDPADRPADAARVIQALCAVTNQPIPTESATIRESFLQASRFVGRSSEMILLKAALETILQLPENATAQVILIGGESGVGKSRLLDEIRTRALVKGALVLRGQSVAEGGFPYQLWRNIARELCLSTALTDLEASILKEIVPDMGILLEKEIANAPELPDAAGQQRLVLLLVELCKRQTQPLVLLLEDLQWASESLAPIKQILQVRDQLPQCLVIGNYRDDERPDLPNEFPHAQAVKLPRLDDNNVAELAHSILGEAGTQPEILALLKRETEGNAFFMVETVRALAEEAGTLSAIGQSTLPQTVFAGGVQQIIQRRLHRIPKNMVPTLQLAAVIGRYVDEKILIQTIHYQEDLERFLTQCANAGVLEITDGQWRFAHDKLRETVLQNLSEEERAAHHRNAAYIIEQAYPDDENYFEILLDHWRAGGNRDKELVYLLPVVRDWVQRRADYGRAVQTVEQALQQSDLSDTLRCDLLNLGSKAALRFGSNAQSKIWAEQAHQIAQQIGEKRLLAASLEALGWVAWHSLGDFPAARDYFQQCVDLLRELGEKRALADNLINLGFHVRELFGDLQTMQDFQTAYDIAQAIGDQHLMARALMEMGTTMVFDGNPQAASNYNQQAITIAREIGDKQILVESLSTQAWIATGINDYAAAKDANVESLLIAREIGSDLSISQALRALVQITQLQGDIAAALAYLEQLQAHAKRITDPVEKGNAQWYTGAAAFLVEEYALAIEHNQQALALYSSQNATQWVAMTHTNLGDVYAALDNVAHTTYHYQQAIAIYEVMPNPYWFPNTLNSLGLFLLRHHDLAGKIYLKRALVMRIELKIVADLLTSLAALAEAQFLLGHYSDAAEIMGLAWFHPKCPQSVRNQLTKLQAKLAQHLSPEDLAAAMERGKALDLDATVQRFLAELSEG